MTGARTFRRSRPGTRHAIIAAAFLLLGTAGSPAHSGDDMQGMTGMQPAGEFAFGRPAKPEQADRAVRVTMADASFEPHALSVKAGETIRFIVTNKSDVKHDFTLGDTATQQAHRQEMTEAFEKGEEMRHHGDPNAVMVMPGQTAELTWTFTRPGDLEFDCNIPGHYEAGMAGKIVVEP